MGRPAPRFRGFIGHKQLVDPILRELQGAKAHGEPLGHLRLTGTSGVGKTQLAKSLAEEYGTRLLSVMGKRAGSFLSFCTNKSHPLSAEDVLFYYDKHRQQLSKWVADGRLDLVNDSLWALKTQLQSKHHFDEVKRNRQHWQNLGNFLQDLPGDLRDDAKSFFAEHSYPMPRGRRIPR